MSGESFEVRIHRGAHEIGGNCVELRHGSGVDLHEAGHLRDRVPFTLGPFTITPHLADHSAYDAFSLLIEARGRNLFYTGDIRGHGRKASAFDRLLADPPRPVHAILMEGTSFRTHDPAADGAEPAPEAGRLTEADVETQLDLYTSDIAAATGRPTIPVVSQVWPRVHVYAPLRQRVRVKESGECERVARIRDQRLYAEQLRERAGRLVLFGAYQGEIPSLVRDGLLTGGAVVWSMWDGYLNQPSGQRLRTALQSANVPLVQHHTSGHATPADLARLVQALRPDAVVPIHTDAPDAYASTVGESVETHADGAWWTV